MIVPWCLVGQRLLKEHLGDITCLKSASLFHLAHPLQDEQPGLALGWWDAPIPVLLLHVLLVMDVA